VCSPVPAPDAAAAPPDAYTSDEVAFVAARVLELVYTAWDMQPFARDLSCDKPPFGWDEERRAHLRAQLDAFYFHKYGLTEEETAPARHGPGVHRSEYKTAETPDRWGNPCAFADLPLRRNRRPF
jgi:hypothetical protein